MWIVCALAAGCTAANPSYVPPDASTTIAFDFAVPPGHDFAMPPPPPDFSTPPECVGAQRSCTQDTLASERCVNNMFVPDRSCPMDSVCQMGYCQVPPQSGDPVEGMSCNSENGCDLASFGESCQPFVIDPQQPALVEFHCAPQVGDGASGNACMDGSTCRSGFCIAATSTCFRACSGDGDCPFRNGVQTMCRPVLITVEGVELKAASCVNP